jgi:hypothetical protein
MPPGHTKNLLARYELLANANNFPSHRSRAVGDMLSTKGRKEGRAMLYPILRLAIDLVICRAYFHSQDTTRRDIECS